MKRFLYGTIALFLLGQHYLIAVNTDRWMSDLQHAIADRQINQIIIPGTHDSATDRISFQSPVGPGEAHPFARFGAPVIAKWARAQGKSIADQLKAGIRYLDLRIIWDENRKGFYSVHMLEGQNVQDIINEVGVFISMPGHEKEIVILDFNHFYRMDDAKKQQLADMLKAAFGTKLATKKFGPTTKMNQFWEQGHQVIVLYDHHETVNKNDFLWGQDAIWSEWPNAQSSDELKGKLGRYINDAKKTGKFFVTQGIITPDAKMIAKGLIPFSKDPSSLEDLAKKINPQVCKWLSDWKSQLNIVIADYFGPNSCLEGVINLNA